jgi:hypothetical protein
LNRSIVEISNQISGVTAANYTGQLNNFGACREVLCKRICELDETEAISSAEDVSRVSPVSQAHIQSQGIQAYNAALSTNDDRFLALNAKLDKVIASIVTK